jgi:4-carboxymuconolactone decarboxylase
MDESRFDRGMKKLLEVDGEGGERVMQSLKDIAPDLATFIVEFAFGDIYSRKGLSLRERELITTSSLLTAGGCEPQLEVHINGALNVGISPEELVEAFLQCIPYTGFPRVLNAIFLAKKVFARRGLHIQATSERGISCAEPEVHRNAPVNGETPICSAP